MKQYFIKGVNPEGAEITSVLLTPEAQFLMDIKNRYSTQGCTPPPPPEISFKTRAGKKGTNGTVDPITDEEDILAAQEYFLSKDQRYRYNKLNIRNYTLFTLGMNCSRRIGDLLHLKIEDVYFEDLTVKPYLKIKEQKTGKYAKVLLNEVVANALKYYIDSISGDEDFSSEEPLFKSREKRDVEKIYQKYRLAVESGDPQKIKYAKERLYVAQYFGNAIEPRSAWRIYNDMAKAIGLDRKGLNIGTHSTRKGWAHKVLENDPKNPEAILVVSEAFNHDNIRSTRRYCGATQDVIDDTIKKVRLGKSPEQIMNSRKEEFLN